MSIIECAVQRRYYSAVLRVTELSNNGECLSLIKERLQDYIKRLQADLLSSSAHPSVQAQALATENKAQANEPQPHAAETKDAETKAQAAETQAQTEDKGAEDKDKAQPQAQNAGQGADQGYPDIHVVTVVNNQPMYDKLFYQNACVTGPNIYLHPMLNPDPKEPERVFGLPEAYNKFLDAFDYSKPAWIVFCHNDLEFEDDLTGKLAALDPGKIYGLGHIHRVNFL